MMGELQSETMAVSAPMSYSGSARRIGGPLWSRAGTAVKVLVGWWLVPILVVCAWVLVTCWYLVFGLLLAPYRLLRRGSRKRKREEQRHREMLDASRQASESQSP